MSELINIFYIILVILPVGGIFASVGYFKGKIQQHTNAIENLASKDELAVVIKRAEEDRAKGQEQWREFQSIQMKVSALEAQLKSMVQALGEIKNDLNRGFDKLETKIEESRKLR